MSLVCIGSFPGRPDFKGLGELTAGELAPLLDTRQPVTAAQSELAGRAWQAFRSSSPGDLDALRQGDTSALPYLRVAPNTVLNVCEPAPNSGVFVLPTVLAPASRNLVTMKASRVGTVSR